MNKIIAIQGAEGSNHHKVARDFYGDNIQLKECMSFDALVAHLFIYIKKKSRIKFETFCFIVFIQYTWSLNFY